MIGLTLLLFTANSYAVQTCVNNIPNTTPDDRYTIDTDQGTVIDKLTKLMWQQCSVGQTQTGTACNGNGNQFDWQTALQAGPSSSVANYNDWRLPNRNELVSLIAWHCNSPSINATVFPNTALNAFWSSSPYFRTPDSAWRVDFPTGGSGRYFRNYAQYYVRLVRNLTE